MSVIVRFADVEGRIGKTEKWIYAVVIAGDGKGSDFCLKGMERTGKTRFTIADELEKVARELRGPLT